jgi:hypothetical protein
MDGDVYVYNNQLFMKGRDMFRNLLVTGVLIAGVVMLSECQKNPVATANDTNPTAPAGSSLLFSEGFGGDLSKWDGIYQVSGAEKYKQMRITTAAAKSGTHSLTTDSSMTALCHRELADSPVDTGIAGVEYYMMAQTLGQINFGLEIGKDPGSSGAVTPAFGIFFDPSDSIKCIVHNTWPAVDTQIAVEKITASRWYKFKVEVNMTDSTANYFIDDNKILTLKLIDNLKDAYPLGINRLLICRGTMGMNFSSSAEGVKPYFIDDIVYYKK